MQAVNRGKYSKMSVSKLQSYSYTPKTTGIIYESIIDRLKLFAEKTPEKVACVFLYPEAQEGRKQITYKELYENSKLIAKGLRKLSVCRGDVVALGILNDPEWMVCTFACQMIGALPLHFMFQRKDGSDIVKILKTVGNCTALICDPGNKNCNIDILKKFLTVKDNDSVCCDSVPSLKYLISTKKFESDMATLTLQNIIDLGNTGGDIDTSIISPDDIAAIVLSSGSTGQPKAVPHSHYSLIMMGYHFKSVLNLTENDVYYNDKTFNWIGGYPHEMIYCGSTRVTVHSLGVFKNFKEMNTFFCNTIDAEGVTSALMITPCLHDMIVGGIPPCKKLPLKSVGTGGQPVPGSVTSCTGALCQTLAVIYGSTEIGFVSAKILRKGDKYVDYNVGKTLPGVEMKVVDEHNRAVSPGVTGELYVRHPVIFLGYVNEPQKTNNVYEPSGWYKTDDVGHMSENMDFHASGRKSDTVIVAGKILAVSYIESIIKTHPDIYDAIVVSISSEGSFHQICAAVVVKPGCVLSAEQIKAYMSDQYTPENCEGFFRTGVVPKFVLLFESFPKTFNGKVFRRGVTDIVHQRLSQNQESITKP